MRALLPILLLAALPAFPQHRARNTVDLSRLSRAEKSTARPKAARPRVRAAEPRATAIVQAPAVVQINLLDPSNVVWLVTTEPLPAGTRISPYIVFPDDFEIPLDTVQLDEPVNAGASFVLPNIRRFGDFWPSGLLTYGAVITIGGQTSQVSADFPVASFRNYEDVQAMVPRIETTAEGINDRDFLLSIRGAFTAEDAYVAIEDFIVPRSAMRLSPSEITVNLSRVPGLDLASMWDALLTVGQSGWSDTAIYRHVPARPGSYRPAPE
jgi:hypothetical protein